MIAKLKVEDFDEDTCIILIMWADQPISICLDATPPGPLILPSPSSPHFTPDAFPAATLAIYPGLGQAPNMLNCISGGLVNSWYS